jgi:hypothetical protein
LANLLTMPYLMKLTVTKVAESLFSQLLIKI